MTAAQEACSDFLVWFSKFFRSCRSFLVIVQPETGARLYQQGFRLYRRCNLRAKAVGRLKIEAELRNLILQICFESTS